MTDFRSDPLYPYIEEKLQEGDYEFALRNLLAVLNGDGGHYQQEHGVAEAIAAAYDRFYDLLEKAEAT